MPFAAPQRIAMPVSTYQTNMPDGIATGNALRIDDWDPTFSMLNDGNALFYRMMSMFNKGADSFQPRINWFEDDIMDVTTTVAATQAGTGGSDAITLTHPQMVGPNSKVINLRTGEHLLVSTVNAAGILTSQRGQFGTTAGTWTEGDEVICIQNMLPEGGKVQNGRTHIPEEKFNWVAFYSTSNEESDVQQNTEMLAGVTHLPDMIRKSMIRVMIMMDQDLRYSRRHATTVPTSGDATDSGRRIYTFDGIEALLGQAETIPAGADWLTLNSILNPIFTPSASSSEKVLVMGPAMWEKFTKLAWDRFTQPPAFESTLGAQVAAIATSQGYTVNLVLDKHGMTARHNAANKGYLLDMKHIQHRQFRGMGLQIKDVTDPSGHHIQKQEIFGSQTLQIKHANDVHAVLTWND